MFVEQPPTSNTEEMISVSVRELLTNFRHVDQHFANKAGSTWAFLKQSKFVRFKSLL